MPTVAAGWADWSDSHEEQQRVGLVHAAVNATAVACFAAALLRRRGRLTLSEVEEFVAAYRARRVPPDISELVGPSARPVPGRPA